MDEKVAVAAVSADAARAGARAADLGGNAVDAALAAGLTAAVTHPGMCSLGGAVFVTVWPPDEAPVVVDGAVKTPGRGLASGERGGGSVEVRLGFGGGVETEIGPGSVAVPGLPAGCSEAARRYGRLPGESCWPRSSNRSAEASRFRPPATRSWSTPTVRSTPATPGAGPP